MGWFRRREGGPGAAKAEADARREPLPQQTPRELLDDWVRLLTILGEGKSLEETFDLIAQVNQPGVHQELLSEVIFPLALHEMDQLQTPSGDETVDVGDERLGHRVHQRRGRILMTPVTNEKARDPTPVGQPRHPHVEIHSIDRLHLEDHMISKDIRDTAR